MRQLDLSGSNEDGSNRTFSMKLHREVLQHGRARSCK